MQKRSKSSLKRKFAPIRLNPKFPILSAPYNQPDRPIEELHIHDVFELGYCWSGSGIFLVEDKVLPFHAGCGLAINTQSFHRARSTPGTKSRWSFIYVDVSGLLKESMVESSLLQLGRLGGSKFPNVLMPESFPGLCELIKDLASELEGELKGYRSCVRGLVRAILVKMHRLPGTKKVESSGRTDALTRISPALSLLADRLEEDIHMTDLADAVHMSPVHFRRVFRKATGQSPKAYQLNVRIQSAAAMLQAGDESILSISQACGFQSLSSFNRRFKQVMKMTPREWRHK